MEFSPQGIPKIDRRTMLKVSDIKVIYDKEIADKKKCERCWKRVADDEICERCKEAIHGR